ncbi:UNVERIFIED_CONTAM: hypothetical protein FKN15_023009 [Acipenser sinensis]
MHVSVLCLVAEPCALVSLVGSLDSGPRCRQDVLLGGAAAVREVKEQKGW